VATLIGAMIGLPGLLVVAALVLGQNAPTAAPAAVPSIPTSVDRAFQRLYNFDFPGSLAIVDEAARAEPGNPLVPAVRASTYLFMEMDRLRILEGRFFMNNDNLVDGSAAQSPDPGVRGRLFAALADARRLAAVRLASGPDDVDALFALCMAASVETDYTALVERRTWRSIKLAPATLDPARKLLARTPPFYDAYLNFGSLEYIIGDLPFFIRWFVHYDGVQGNKRVGIDKLKLTARQGRYYGPFARVLLVVVSLREKKYDDATKLLAELSQEFPENRLFRKELSLVRDKAKLAGRD
jgi:hypothetical protein